MPEEMESPMTTNRLLGTPVISGNLRCGNSSAVIVKRDRHRPLDTITRTLVHTFDGPKLFVEKYQTENRARSRASTVQKNGGEAITMNASAIHAATFLVMNIQRRLKNGDASTAAMSRKTPE
jgi:hypothetical protein